MALCPPGSRSRAETPARSAALNVQIGSRRTFALRDAAGLKLGSDRQNDVVTHPYPQSPRTSPTRNAQRVSYDREIVHAVLDEAIVCHVGFVIDGRPVVLQQLHARLGEVLYLHGSTGARALNAARGDGLQVCVTATLLDGLVLARSRSTTR